MKKALVPMVAALVLSGAATAALIAGSARAQTAPHRPVMVAMMTPRTMLPIDSAAPQGDPGAGPRDMHRPSPAEMAAHHKQMCEDEYAHQVGQLAYLEAKLNLTAAQQPLFDRWKSVKLDIAKRGEADCSMRELAMHNADAARPSPLDGMAREEDMLKRRLADLDAERPVLGALYNSLSAAQKDGLMHPEGMMMGGGRMMDRHMFAEMSRGGMGGPGRMGGPGGRPPAPSAPPPQ